MSADLKRIDDHAPGPLPAGAAAPVPPPAANSSRPTAPLTPYAGRPRLPDNGLRVLPLDSFVWGGPSVSGRMRRGRTRGDHCLMRVTEGVMRIILPSGAVDHGEGSVIFVPAGTAFAAEPQPGVAGQALLLARDMGGRLNLSLPSRIVVGTGTSDAFSADVAALAARAQDPIASATAACRIELIALGLQRISVQPEPARPSVPGQDSRALVDAFRELADRELGRGRTLSDLAEALGTTAGSLDAACRRQRGCSALDLMYELRLDRARRLLADPGRSLGQIADELGFSGVAHLNRVFVTATGRPAEAFRKPA